MTQFLKRILGVTELERKLELNSRRVSELAESQLRVMDLALKDPGMSPENMKMLRDARSSVLAIATRGAFALAL